MRTVEIEGYSGRLIDSLDDWAEHAMPPERKRKHWKEGRSAYELGRAWTGSGKPAVPAELRELLDSNDATSNTVIARGWTERETPLPPQGSRGPRCHDLALLAEQTGQRVTICIEAKADETFGGTVGEEFLNACRRADSQELRRSGQQHESKFPERLDWLTRSLLRLPAFNDGDHKAVSEQVRGVSYQLLTAMAGTLLEARRQCSAKAALVIHEFRTVKTKDENMERNARALDGFLRFLFRENCVPDEASQFRDAQLYGPVLMKEWNSEIGVSTLNPISLLIGKIRTDCTVT